VGTVVLYGSLELGTNGGDKPFWEEVDSMENSVCKDLVANRPFQRLGHSFKTSVRAQLAGRTEARNCVT
jgi:hypothetical protein